MSKQIKSKERVELMPKAQINHVIDYFYVKLTKIPEEVHKTALKER